MLILASASPRRRDLLAQLGIPFTSLSPDINEDIQLNETPEAYVARLSSHKAEAILKTNPDAVVLAADTTVALGSHIMGKPDNKEQAFAMWQRLGEQVHTVYTGVTVKNCLRSVTQVIATQVEMRPLTPAEQEWYWQTGEPLDKAGGYGIQGLGGQFIKRIDGSYSNVVGLPLVETAQALQIFGLMPHTNLPL